MNKQAIYIRPSVMGTRRNWRRVALMQRTALGVLLAVCAVVGSVWRRALKRNAREA